MSFDLLIKGGHVVDPATGLDEMRDVAVTGDRIAAVEPSLPADQSTRVIDATDRYVTPGLIDMHTHVYWGGSHGVDRPRAGVSPGAPASPRGSTRARSAPSLCRPSASTS